MAQDAELQTIHAVMQSTFAALASQAAARVQRAYEIGFRDGSMATRDSILAAAGAPLVVNRNGSVTVSAVGAASGSATVKGVGEAKPVAPPDSGADPSDASKRAPKGLVGKLIAEVLRETHGLSISEIEARVSALDSRIAGKSVGNELRRHEGSKYDRRDKYSWYLNGVAFDKETAGPTPEANPAASLFSTERG